MLNDFPIGLIIFYYSVDNSFGRSLVNSYADLSVHHSLALVS